MSFPRRFFFGFSFLLTGFKIFRAQPSLRFWAIAPFVLNFIILVVGIFWATYQLPDWINYFLLHFFPYQETSIFSIMYYLILFLFWFFCLLIWTYTIFIIGNFLASPFHSILAEKSLFLFHVMKPTSRSLKERFINWFQLFFVSILKVFVFFVLGLLIVALSFLPGLNFLAAYFALMMISFDCLDYSFEALSMSFSQRMSHFRSLLPEAMGMAAALSIIFFIPGLLLFLMPVAVVGATNIVKNFMDKKEISP